MTDIHQQYRRAITEAKHLNELPKNKKYKAIRNNYFLHGSRYVKARRVKLFGSRKQKILQTLKIFVRKIDEDEASGGKKIYSTATWRRIRERVLKKQKECVFCGSKESLQADHIKPRSLYPELALCEKNVQTLCQICNIKKGNKEIKRPSIGLE